MSIPKICGIETEYGIIAKGMDASAVTASSLLINSYVGRLIKILAGILKTNDPATTQEVFHWTIRFRLRSRCTWLILF